MSTDSAETQIFSNDNLEVAVNHLPNAEVTFNILVKPPLLKKGQLEAIKQVTKQVEIPGFRKGKAPEKYVETHFKGVIDKETKDLTSRFSIHEAFYLTNIHPFDNESTLKMTNFKWDYPDNVHLSVTFETFPNVPSIALDELHAQPAMAEEVTEEEIDEILKNLQLDKATYTVVEDKALDFGDWFDLTITPMEDPEAKILHHKRFQLTQDLPQGLLDAVLGLKNGESAENIDFSTLRADKNAEDDAPPMRLTIEAVLKEELPTIDEEFAKSFGADSIEDMRAKIAHRRLLEKQEQSFQGRVQTLKNDIIEKYPFEIPEKRIQQLIDELWKDQLKRWREKEINLSPEDTQAEKAKFDERQRFNFRKDLLLQKLAKEHKIELTEEEISAEMQPLFSFHKDFSFLMKLMGDEKQLRKELEGRAWDRKIGQFLLSRASAAE